MEDELKPAQETEETSEVSGNADANQQEAKEQSNEVEFTDSTESGEAQPQQTTQEKPLTKEQNSENARRRREAERQREIQTAREQAIIETLGGKNPYTNEEMKDSADVQEYLTMKEIESQGGDPLADFSKFQKAKTKERIAKQTREQAEKDWYRNDAQSFQARHPEVNIDTLIQDKQFQKFASGKVGTLPLAEIYDGYMELVAEFDKKSKQKAAQILANKKASPGALSSPNGNSEGLFTREQVQAMSQEEVHKNYDKIRASMRKW